MRSADAMARQLISGLQDLLDQGRRRQADALAHIYGARSAEKLIRRLTSTLRHRGGSPED